MSERSDRLATLRKEAVGVSAPALPVGAVTIGPPVPSRMARLQSTIGGALRSLKQMVFRANAYRIFSIPGSRHDYLSEVGDGTGSSTVTAPLFWVARTFPEAPPALWQAGDEGQETKVRDHPMLRLMTRPNPFFTGVVMWMATVIDYYTDGNAYWIKVRNELGEVVELWWTPSWLIRPEGNESKLITHYEYSPGTEPLGVAVEDVVHFRFGADPEDQRLGRSPLKSVLREVFTDDEAASFTASLLRNMGVPGLILSPKQGVSIAPADAAEAKQSLMDKFRGDRRGEPIVMTGATDVEQFGFSPEQMLLRELRRIPEERVTAVMGVPAIVAGLGAGLDRSTFSNMGEAREAAYESGIIPVQRIMAEDIRFQLLPDYERDPFLWRFGFDLSKVRVLQEDQYRLVQRHAVAVREGVEMVSEMRRAIDLPVESPRDDVFLRPANIVTVPTGQAGDQVALPSSQNGNGRGTVAETVAAVEHMLDRRELTQAT